ncbi:MAG TPA: hypothetical protein VMT16_11120 [Thermoanaerobaculia bacterium]|nr:hypothetical protein [Thermoanaerobaculia bacterium]
MPVLTISKIEAARRQLETAIILYFSERDPVSIHTLAGAGYELVANLARKAGHDTLIETGFLGKLPPEIAKLARKAIRTPQNFFKHADRDDPEALPFDPQLSELIVMDAIAKYSQLAGEVPLFFDAFSKWFSLQHPEFFAKTSHHALIQQVRQLFGGLDRQTFLSEYLTATATSQHP